MIGESNNYTENYRLFQLSYLITPYIFLHAYVCVYIQIDRYRYKIYISHIPVKYICFSYQKYAGEVNW